MWWFDFVDSWGNSASVVGILISLLTLIVALRIKPAQREAVRKVALVVLSGTVDELHNKLTIASEAGRLGLWQRAFDYCRDARFTALRLVGNPHLTQDEKDALRGSADNLTQVIRYIERYKLGANPSDSFQQDKKSVLDDMVTLLTNIQSRLSARTWEV